MKRILLFMVLACSFAKIFPQNITTTYSYTWKYDTAYKGQIGQTDFSYTGSVQTFNASPGTYTLEVWGAQGGNDPYYPASVFGGRGGYSVGELHLVNSVTLYVYVGGQGYGSSSSSWGSTGGGGATDISLYGVANSTTWNSSSHFYSRIIVAGGGGGVHGKNYASSTYVGNDGGGYTSPTFTANNYTITGSTYNSSGTSSYGSGVVAGSFGYATGNTYCNNYSYGGWNGGGNGSDCWANGGAGGGWYGGVTSWSHSAGGSGYVLTSSSYKPTGYTPTSDYYMTNANSIAGNTTMPAPGGGTELGHSGNGHATISYNTFTIDHIDSSISYTYVTTTITDFVCKNGIYNKYGFSVDGSTLSSGVHTYTHFTQTASKDSTTILNLTIKPGTTDFIEIDAPYSYTWPINGETYTQSGIYEFTTVSADGCDSTVILALTIYDPTIGIEENTDIQDVIVSPNPAWDYINIKNDDDARLVMKIYNLYGQLCLEKKLKGKVSRISISSRPSGTYFINFNSAGKIFKTQKIVIAK